ncbi:dephospho-CoA kinase [Arthrobacter sp. CDRTa11]|uniref:dephospho-CoA kinase n=1 Tax=Arthrobacter sp. CDRTa11 TaxID=2651199 RepID=UPI0022659ADD|nr:dephospho-CoA kinase [Arthrobacter sp. CDRTa11]UZX03357.1 dephospho-CoA kinase [Arthrobacter sp. CDRTa11]
MLKIGLTGGIASGKSVVASRLAHLGAVLVDADALAREVLEPGTPGLAAVVEAFGSGMLDGGGRLDRAKLGAVVFGNPERLAVLNGIVHPLVRQAAAGIVAAAPFGAVVVQDIPLLVETGQGSDFHLVVVVDAPDEVRIRRMLDHRRMTSEEAQSRMAAQASRDERLAAADVVLDNSGSMDGLLAQVDALWAERLAPFARNLLAQTPADRPGGPVLHAASSEWPRTAERLITRILAALRKDAPDGEPAVLGLDHVGSTSVPGLDAKDVLDLQLTVPALSAAAPLEPALAAAGYPRVHAITADTPKPTLPDTTAWAKRLHASADPGRAVNLHIRAAGSAGWRFALCFRDWLRADPDTAADYLALKRRLAELHATDPSTAAYAAAKEAWFAAAEEPMEQWAKRSGWVPPSYPS